MEAFEAGQGNEGAGPRQAEKWTSDRRRQQGLYTVTFYDELIS